VDLEEILYRIISGYYYITVNNSIYKIYSPKLNLKQKAHSLYLSILEDNKYDTSSWISKSVIDNLLKIYDIWDNKREDNLNHLVKSLENAKIELYLNFSKIKQRESIKNLIASINKQINENINKKHYFDCLTLEYYSSSLKNQYLLMHTVYTEKDEKVFGDSLDDVDTIFLEKIIYEIYHNSISMDDIKNLASNELWRSYWDSSKDSIFEGKPTDWTEEQRSLVNITKMMDAIREHHERPPEEVFGDFDALDGWILHQKQTAEKEKKKEQISSMVSGNKKERMDEVFVVTNSTQEAQEIFSLNDPTTRQNIKTMSKIVQEKGPVKWSELPHVKREIQNKFNEMKRDKIKGN
jgi:hypothetical protein